MKLRCFSHRMIFHVAVLLAAMLLSRTATARGRYFDFNATARDAYQKTISLRFVEARALIDRLKREEPDNLIPLFVENYWECLYVFAEDDEALYDRYVRGVDKRLSLLSRGDRSSPYYLYCQAETRLQWALLRGRFGAYLSALSDIKQGYALLEQNVREHPDFVANKKSLGIIHSMVGNVPKEYKWAVRAVGGMSGNMEQGLKELDEVLVFSQKNDDFVFGTEALVASCFLRMHVNNQGDAMWQVFKDSRIDPGTSPLAAYAMASLAMKTGRSAEAIQLLEDMPLNPPYHYLHYRNYLLGLAKLYRLDEDAHKPLFDFVNNFHGTNAVKEAYQKLAWHYFIHGDEKNYWNYLYHVKVKGTDKSDPDKAALREANSGETPDRNLLKARVLFDGGYYKRALELLRSSGGKYTYDKYTLEYNYRLGRIAHKMGNTDEALQRYQKTVLEGAKAPWQFACNSALQMGLIYEGKGDWKNAKVAFQQCLKIDPEEYAASFHAKAKAGLNRVKK
jgi:tetratricopeptide (TPR) repeat protein